MRYRPTEIKALVEILDREHPDVTELAKSIIMVLDGMRAQRSGWYINWPRLGTHLIFGPFASADSAVKTVKKVAWDSTARVAYLMAFTPEALSDPEVIGFMVKGETPSGETEQGVGTARGSVGDGPSEAPSVQADELR